MSTKSSIKSKCKKLEELLLYKNEKYGDSALQPLNIFSKAGPVAGLKMQIDHKLKRIMNAGLVDATEDTLQDLAGYLILLMIAKDNESNHIRESVHGERSPRTSISGVEEDTEWEVIYSD
jgi:hypothetical protein